VADAASVRDIAWTGVATENTDASSVRHGANVAKNATTHKVGISIRRRDMYFFGIIPTSSESQTKFIDVLRVHDIFPARTRMRLPPDDFCDQESHS